MPVPDSARIRRPARTALAVALLFALGSVFTFAVPSQTLAWDAESFSSQSAADLVALTNRSRASAGLKALIVDSTLSSVARWRSKDMIDRDYFSHTIPGYGKVWDKLQAVGYCYKVAGENIGWNNYPDDIATAAVHQAFMDSAGHRANILGSAWDHIGVGAYKGPTGKKMWTVLFADKCGTAAAATPKPTAKPAAKPAAKPTPRPTPKPTPRPTPKPAAIAPALTPEPTPEIIEEPSIEPTPSLPANEVVPPTASPSAEPANDVGQGPIGMRVVDEGAAGGLLETIVGGVTGYFFGG